MRHLSECHAFSSYFPPCFPEILQLTALDGVEVCMASNESPIEKIQKHFQALAGIAPSLNAVSDELTQAVGVLDEALKKLNIGLSAWVTFRSRADDDYPQFYDLDQIGYCKVDGAWGIAIQRIWGDESEVQGHHSEGPWLFNDAPREMRIRAVDSLPEVIEQLSKIAARTQRKIQEKTKSVKDLADAIRQDTSGNKILAKGLSLGQVKAITVAVAAQQKFLGEIVQQAHRWERDGDTLSICFSSEKRAFAEMLQGRDALLKVRNAVQGILGTELGIGVHTDQGSGSTSKVQK